MIEGIQSGLDQGGLIAVAIIAVVVLLVILLLTSIVRLGAVLARIGCIVVVIAAFLYALSKLFGA